MKRVLIIMVLGLGVTVWGRAASGDNAAAQRSPLATASPTPAHTPLSGGLGGLPGRPTSTPAPTVPFVWPTSSGTPVLTSPDLFSTRTPSPTPAIDCTSIFPLDNVATIDFGQTTISQLEASFGRAERIGGRAVQVRFDEQGCSLWVTLGGQQALDAELADYGTLADLLDWYGTPEAVGVSQGNLTLMVPGQAVLLYADAGVIAIFESDPDLLTLDSPIQSLQLRPAYTLEKQVKRLNLRLIEWHSPVVPG